jgi:NUDIX domain
VRGSELVGRRCFSSTVHGTETGRSPKGKARDGETDEECALREVEEETGSVAASSASSRHLSTLTERSAPR